MLCAEWTGAVGVMKKSPIPFTLKSEIWKLRNHDKEAFLSLTIQMAELLLDPDFADLAAGHSYWPVNVPVRRTPKRQKIKMSGGYQWIDMRTREDWCARVLDNMLQVGVGLPIDLRKGSITLSKPFTALAYLALLAMVELHMGQGHHETDWCSYRIPVKKFETWLREARRLPILTKETSASWAKCGFKYAQLCFGEKLERAETLESVISIRADASMRTKSERGKITYREKYFTQAFTLLVTQQTVRPQVNMELFSKGKAGRWFSDPGRSV